MRVRVVQWWDEILQGASQVTQADLKSQGHPDKGTHTRINALRMHNLINGLRMHAGTTPQLRPGPAFLTAEAINTLSQRCHNPCLYP